MKLPVLLFILKLYARINIFKSGILFSMGVQKLCGPEISWFLPYMGQFLDNLRQFFIFSYYIRGNESFHVGPSEKILIVDHPKENRNEQEIKR